MRRRGKKENTIQRHTNGREEEDQTMQDRTLHQTKGRRKKDGLKKHDLTINHSNNNYYAISLFYGNKYILFYIKLSWIYDIRIIVYKKHKGKRNIISNGRIHY